MSATLAPSRSTNTTAPRKQTISAMRITELVEEMEQELGLAISNISELNSETKIISINAQMEAARAGGTAGRAFDVVAKSIREVSRRTAAVFDHMTRQTHEVMAELRFTNHELATRVQGERLSNLALMNIDVIDRNLYERSCDCRWWATDHAMVQVLEDPTPANIAEASRRLGQILDSYTVYFDIVVADLEGRIVANGRPLEFPVVRTRHDNEEWFSSAMATVRGDQFGFQTVNSSNLANGQRTLVYSCTVRKGGAIDGDVLGVIGLVFRWDALGQTVVARTPLSEEERSTSRVLITDAKGLVLADTREQFLSRVELPDLAKIFSQPKNYAIVAIDGKPHFVAHAQAPGFETYSTGWHSLVIQRLTHVKSE